MTDMLMQAQYASVPKAVVLNLRSVWWKIRRAIPASLWIATVKCAVAAKARLLARLGSVSPFPMYVSHSSELNFHCNVGRIDIFVRRNFCQ